MLHHIKKLQQHPEPVRQRIALAIAGTVTLLIFGTWVMTLDSRLALDDWGGETQTAAVGSAGGLVVVEGDEPSSPAAIIKEKVGDAYGSFRDAVGY